MHVHRALRELIDRFVTEPAVRDMKEELLRLDTGHRPDAETLIRIYRDALSRIEEVMWAAGPDIEALENYQKAFREVEGLIEQYGVDHRHRFFVIIPVADRPQHLRKLLDSLLSQCRAFNYGGFRGRFRKVSVVVADDSREESNIRRNREILQAFGRRGLGGIYFGANEQIETLNTLTPEERTRFTRILGETGCNGMHHKGASITRNLAYLLASSLNGPDRALFLFVDSDEQFKVRVAASEGSRDLVALNYFHALDRLFTERNIQVATGKVVGDPPVSPAVMTGNFLVDVITLLERMAAVDPGQTCSFHGDPNICDDAAYHDMAGLFGFQHEEQAHVYRCALDGAHDHADCFADFADKLDRFFDGEHLTRATYYSYSDAVTTATPARTVYTGNYVLNEEALKYFIPFADLKLRMAGPTLGRLIQAELGEGFVAINLPLLHTRTVDEQFEFRSGVERSRRCVDLCGEFERQFFGDVMLFTICDLVGLGYPERVLSDREIRATVEGVEARMRRFYAGKRREIQDRLAKVRALFDDPERWWHRSDMAAARARFQHFFHNVEHNFGPASKAHALIESSEHRAKRLMAIEKAIASYHTDRAAWESLLSRRKPVPEQRREEVAT